MLAQPERLTSFEWIYTKQWSTHFTIDCKVQLTVTQFGLVWLYDLIKKAKCHTSNLGKANDAKKLQENMDRQSNRKGTWQIEYTVENVKVFTWYKNRKIEWKTG